MQPVVPTPPQTVSSPNPGENAWSPPGETPRDSAVKGASRDTLVDFFVKEWHWFLIGVIYLFAWFIPARWAWQQWSDSYTALCFQPFVPIGTALLIWGQRVEFATQWRRLLREHSPTSKRGRGSLLPLTIGCALLLISNIIQVKGGANVALVLIAIGVLYQVYGPVMLRVLTLPILFFCLIIMPPDSVTFKFETLFLQTSIKIAASILNLLHRGSGQYYLLGFQNLHLPTTTIDFLLSGCRGFSTAVPVAVMLGCWMIYKRVRFNYGLMVILGGFVLAIVVNVARIVLVAELYPTNSGLADAVKFANNWLFTIPLVFMTLMMVRGVEWLLKHSPAPVRDALNKVGNVVNLIIYPFVFLLYQLGRIVTLQKRSERGLERFLKNISPKKKDRRY